MKHIFFLFAGAALLALTGTGCTQPSRTAPSTIQSEDTSKTEIAFVPKRVDIIPYKETRYTNSKNKPCQDFQAWITFVDSLNNEHAVLLYKEAAKDDQQGMLEIAQAKKTYREIKNASAEELCIEIMPNSDSSEYDTYVYHGGKLILME